MWSIIWVLNWESLNPPRKFVDLSVTFGGVGSLKFSFWAHATALPVLMLSSWLFFGRESIVFNVLPNCKFIDHFCAKRAWSHCRTNSRSGGPLNGGLVLFAGTKRTWGVRESFEILIKCQFRKISRAYSTFLTGGALPVPEWIPGEIIGRAYSTINKILSKFSL